MVNISVGKISPASLPFLHKCLELKSMLREVNCRGKRAQCVHQKINMLTRVGNAFGEEHFWHPFSSQGLWRWSACRIQFDSPWNIKERRGEEIEPAALRSCRALGLRMRSL